ncbi:hypothetical protein CYMTET_39587 [Cymbomonas tetramitiformis]|uniref:Uncharacterized protein n=1 Tax=Cymbomonas tetramitiformis TaxID=36881 RepID=A0AAE0CAY3_9CHLO|nr:hypothetical protein CYMTET_39587 [Cymbomonas tetramitiformis]
MGNIHDNTDTSIDMIMIDNTENEEVFMLSNNICNIAKEFDKMRDMRTITTEGLSGAVGVALCMSFLIGKNRQAMNEIETPLRLLAMMTEDVQEFTVSTQNVTRVTDETNILWDVCCVSKNTDAPDVDHDSSVSVLYSND